MNIVIYMGENSITKIITLYANTIITHLNIIATYLLFSLWKERENQESTLLSQLLESAIQEMQKILPEAETQISNNVTR